jgi:hypothetical protein
MAAMHLLEGSARASALALVVVRHTTHPTKLSTGALVAAALAALLLVLCLVWAAARWWAYEPRWSVSLRHCIAEASWRLSGTWEEFSDWVRLGR